MLVRFAERQPDPRARFYPYTEYFHSPTGRFTLSHLDTGAEGRPEGDRPPVFRSPAPGSVARAVMPGEMGPFTLKIGEGIKHTEATSSER